MASKKTSLMNFVEFVCAQTPAKRASTVEKAKQRFGVAYDVRRDFYGPLRKRIVSMHENGEPPEVLDEFLGGVHDRKRENYERCIEGYARWLQGRDVEWIGGRSQRWTLGDLEVAVNPEFVARINGEVHAGKLYFSAPKLAGPGAAVAAHLIQSKFQTAEQPGVLDLRRSDFLLPTGWNRRLDAVIAGDAAAFSAMWDVLPSAAA